MHSSILSFVSANVKNERGQKIIDFGSRDINGTAKSVLEKTDYIGLDTVIAKNVDEVIKFGEKLQFNDDSVDTVLCIETSQIDHSITQDIKEFHRVLKPCGTLIFTARSKDFPSNFMGREVIRYSETEIRELLKDFENIVIIKDPELTGWLCKCNKKVGDVEVENGRDDTRHRGRPKKF